MNEPTSRLFASCPEEACDGYRTLYEGSREPVRRLRKRLEVQYARLAPYLDSNFCHEFPLKEKFESRVWELKVGSALLFSAREPLQRALPKAAGGPDFTVRSDGGVAHVEAIRPLLGCLESQWDCMLKPDGHEFTGEDIEAQVTRLTGAFETKRQKFSGYLRKAVIGPDDALVIAIGDHQTKLLYGSDMPPVFNALFGLGPEVLDIDCHSGSAVRSRLTRQDLRRSRNGKPVNSFLFGGNQPAVEISAVIFSSENLFSNAEESFDDLVLIHNPMAKNPIAEGFLSAGTEWARRGDTIERIAQYSGAADG